MRNAHFSSAIPWANFVDARSMATGRNSGFAHFMPSWSPSPRTRGNRAHTQRFGALSRPNSRPRGTGSSKPFPIISKRSDLLRRKEEGSFHDPRKARSRIQENLGNPPRPTGGWSQARAYRAALGTRASGYPERGIRLRTLHANGSLRDGISARAELSRLSFRADEGPTNFRCIGGSTP